ncbi:4021_t:CDS:1 [Paraglomus brasilianum]|uniref:4021_t:CDS:1 n=1 Tax=Paraglomus brasilianum TaxID=144538 RepID=A0A9N9CAN3_9GLOM|nr:4021_t:CDS:1 [Paraglomus brasilianum]
MSATQSKSNSTSSDNVNNRQSSNASEKATKNREKLKLKAMDRSFVTALVRLVLANDKLCVLVAKLQFALESDPLHPLYEHLDRVQTILTYLCAENPATKDQMRSELKQITAEYISPRPNVHTSNSLPNPNTYADTTVTSKRSASCESTVIEKRSLKRVRVGPYEKVVDFGNLTKEMQEGNASTIPNGHDGQATSFTPLATREQQLLQSSRMQRTCLTSGLNEIQEDNVPAVSNSLVADFIREQQLQHYSGFAPYANSFGTLYSSPPSYNSDDIA